MSSPRPITWWALCGDDQAVFRKPDGLPVLVMEQEGESLREARIGGRVGVPLFTLEDYTLGNLSIPQQIQFRIDALFEEGAPLGEGGRFHGVFKSLESDRQGRKITIGLAYCTEDLVPIFGPPLIGEPVVPLRSCELLGLPTWVTPQESPYTGPRPSRYKRKPVI